MRRFVTTAFVLLTAAPGVAQVRGLTLQAFAFDAGVLAQSQVNASIQLAASATVDIARTGPFEFAIASSVGDLASHNGHQRDLSVSVLRVWPVLSRFASVGAGASLHALRTRVEGAAMDPALAALEAQRSGLHPALNAAFALSMPLASDRGVAFQLSARAAALRELRQLSVAAGFTITPGSRGIQLGERALPPRERSPAPGSWDALVGEIMQLDPLLTAHDVIATPTTLIMRFPATADPVVTTTVSRIARVLAASSENVSLEITAPEPAEIAIAATAAGFPPERIRLARNAHAITVQAIRPVAARGLRPARR